MNSHTAFELEDKREEISLFYRKARSQIGWRDIRIY